MGEYIFAMWDENAVSKLVISYESNIFSICIPATQHGPLRTNDAKNKPIQASAEN